jgi:hypothetical protein
MQIGESFRKPQPKFLIALKGTLERKVKYLHFKTSFWGLIVGDEQCQNKSVFVIGCTYSQKGPCANIVKQSRAALFHTHCTNEVYMHLNLSK